MTESLGSLRSIEQVCARIFHDLSGIIGSLDSVLETVVAEQETRSEAISLAHEAATELTLRLRLLRAAWGPEGESSSVGSLHALAAGLPNAARITVDTSGLAPDVVFPPATARLVLNIFLLSQESLPMGGVIRLAGSIDDLMIIIEGERARWPAALPRYLASDIEASAALTNARTLQAPLTALLARDAGIPLTMLMSTGMGAGLPPLRLGGR